MGHRPHTFRKDVRHSRWQRSRQTGAMDYQKERSVTSVATGDHQLMPCMPGKGRGTRGAARGSRPGARPGRECDARTLGERSQQAREKCPAGAADCLWRLLGCQSKRPLPDIHVVRIQST